MTDDTPTPKSDPRPAPAGERIAKAMARAGVASRRDAERIILAGRVAVNGTIVTSPALDVMPSDRVTLDGKPIDAPQATRMWLYYKPLGLVTSEKDEKGRQTVFDSLPEGMPRVMSIGRLDLNSEGLLLLTNDGALKRRLELPETGWLRKYRVRVNGRPTDEMLKPLREGVTVKAEDGTNETFLPMDITIDRQQGANAWLTIGLREGKNREIRRAMTEVGLVVNRLIRVSYGPFRLNLMKPGEVVEVKARVLREQLGGLAGSGDHDAPRPARKPRALSPGGNPASGGERKPRHKGKPGTDKPTRAPYAGKREGTGDRPARAPDARKAERSGDRPERKPYAGKRDQSGDKPARGPYVGKGDQSGDKPARAPYAAKSERPGDRPVRAPYAGKRNDSGDRPARSPYAGKAERSGDKPARAPYAGKAERSGDRPVRAPDAGKRDDSGDRPARAPYAGKRDQTGDKPARAAYAAKSERPGDRPVRAPYAGKRDDSGDRPARAPYAGKRDQSGDKPARAPYAAKSERPGDKPARAPYAGKAERSGGSDKRGQVASKGGTGGGTGGPRGRGQASGPRGRKPT